MNGAEYLKRLEEDFRISRLSRDCEDAKFCKASLYIGDGKRDIYPKANIINNGRVLSTLKLQE